MYSQIKRKFSKTCIILSSIFALASLSGCGVKYADSKVHPQEFEKGNKAIVITTADHKYKGIIFKGSVPVNFAIAKVDSNYPDLNTRLRYRNWSDFLDLTSIFTPKFFMIDPGTYVLENITYTVGDTDYRSTLDGLNPGTEHFVYGGFNVKPGEIVYLGDLNINLDEKKSTVEVSDNYNTAVKDFLKKHPEYAKYPIKKRFMLGRGTLLSDIK